MPTEWNFVTKGLQDSIYYNNKEIQIIFGYQEIIDYPLYFVFGQQQVSFSDQSVISVWFPGFYINCCLYVVIL